jgi:glutathionyl-hydroquinone reductase
VRSLKGLEPFIQLVVCGFELTKDGWLFDGRDGTAPKDPLYGFTKLGDLYRKADPNYVGRFTVPTLWDKKTETIVNNESSEIIRMFYTEFDHLLPEHLRESAQPGGGGGFYPEHLRKEIDEMNDWVYHTVNNGVYKTGFATTQAAYEANLYPLFESLDRLEKHLGEPGHSPYLFGKYITEADVRLYTTLIRFDVAYVNIFMCNLKMIRYDYPRLSRWLRNLYWDGGKTVNGHVWKDTTYFTLVRHCILWDAKRELRLIKPCSINTDTSERRGGLSQTRNLFCPRDLTRISSHWTMLKSPMDTNRHAKRPDVTGHATKSFETIVLNVIKLVPVLLLITLFA